MVLGWDTTDDFSEVVDTLESVVLRRQDCADDTDTLQGWRFLEVVNATESSQSGVRRIDVTWQLPFGDLLDPPLPGDVIVDESGARSTIIAVSRLRGASRYSCRARRTELHPSKVERFDIDHPIYVATSEGPVLDRWERLRPAVEGFFRSVPTQARQTNTRCRLSAVFP